jgi:hypothetical protein
MAAHLISLDAIWAGRARINLSAAPKMGIWHRKMAGQHLSARIVTVGAIRNKHIINLEQSTSMVVQLLIMRAMVVVVKVTGLDGEENLVSE